MGLFNRACSGLHCPGCGDGGGGGIAIAIIVFLVIAGAAARPVMRAAHSVLRVAIEAAEVLAIVVASAAGLLVLSVLAVAGVRIHRRLARRPYRVTMLPPGELPSGPIVSAIPVPGTVPADFPRSSAAEYLGQRS